MSTTKLAATWFREPSEARDPGRAVLRERPEAGVTIGPDGADDGQFPGSEIVTPRARLLGANGGLDRILVTLMRRLHQAPTNRASARASADRLHETIRALSVF
jgi:hypothetical protein